MFFIISIFMKELNILIFNNNDLLLFSYAHAEFCLIKIPCILIKNSMFLSCSFIVFKSLLKIINIMRPFSFIRERMRDLYNIFRMSFKKSSRPAFSNCRFRIWGMRIRDMRIRGILCENPICTTLMLPILYMSFICFFTFDYIAQSHLLIYCKNLILSSTIRSGHSAIVTRAKSGFRNREISC